LRTAAIAATSPIATMYTRVGRSAELQVREATAIAAATGSAVSNRATVAVRPDR